MPTLSAAETLSVRASLALPSSVKSKERRDRVSAVLSVMGLSHVAHTKVK